MTFYELFLTVKDCYLNHLFKCGCCRRCMV